MFAFFITSLGSRFTHSSRLAHFSYPAVSIFASTFTIPISSASPALLSPFKSYTSVVFSLGFSSPAIVAYPLSHTLFIVLMFKS